MSREARIDSQSGFPVIIPGVSQVKAFTGTSGQSAAVAASTTVVRLCADHDCFIAIGANPTAAIDGTSLFLPAGVVDHVGINGGEKIAVIQSSVAGNLYITEGA